MKEEDKSLVHEELESIVGSENITDKEPILETYSMGQLSFRHGQYLKRSVLPDFIVRAGSVEEIQQILRLANEYKVPVIPVGTQTSWFGESNPVEGGIILNMMRMNHIELDEDNMRLTLEPGVTQGQIWRELTPKGYRVPYFSGLPGSLSYMGISTQRGLGPVWQGQHIESTLQMEVVLPTGEIANLGTPMGRYEWGPDLLGMFLGSQGAYGIVTHQTLPMYQISPDWVENEIVDSLIEIPGNTSYENCKVAVRVLQRVCDDLVHVNFCKTEYIPKREGVRCGVGICGPRERVDFDRKRVEKIFTEVGARLLSPKEWMTLEPEAKVRFIKGRERIPWTWGDGWGRYDKPGSSIMAPIGGGRVSLTTDFLLSRAPDLYKRIGEIVAKHRFHLFYRGMHFRDRFMKTAICNNSFNFNTRDVEETKRAMTCQDECLRIMYDELGGASYRLDMRSAGIAIPRLGGYYELMKKVKKMLDPNGIMNPGRFGL